MTDGLLFFSCIAAGCVRTAVCLFLIFRVLSSEKPGRKSIGTAFAGAAAISVLLSVTGLADFYGIALEAFLVMFCASRFQGADARMSLFVAVFYEMAVSFWHFLFAAWAGVFFHSILFFDDRTVGGQMILWLLHLLLAAVTLYISRHQGMTDKEGLRFVSGIAVAGFFAVITLSEQTALVIAEDALSMWTILSVVLLMSVLVFNMNRQYEAEKELAKLKSEQAELLERDYTALNRAYAVNAKLFHDFHNHIGVLQRLLLHGNVEGAMQYLDELQAPVREMTDTVWTGEETIDYLINSKAAEAKREGIFLQVQVEFPRRAGIRSVDLCAILGNFLDNALDAARQVQKTEQRFIRLTIRRINQMLVIKTENSFSVSPVKEEGVLKTTKMDQTLHGWGLKSAQAAALKYDGIVQTSFSENVFRAVATLSCQGVPAETQQDAP